MVTLLPLLVLGLAISPSLCDTTVTIFPEFLSQNGRTHFEGDRFDGHNGLDRSQYTNNNKAIGTEAQRWMNRDLNGNIFKNTPQDPNHHGYPDPNHFKNHNLQRELTGLYEQQLSAYGNDLDTVMVLKGKYWPNWMDTSHHGGQMPNNLDAGAELVSQMMSGINQQLGGKLPPYFEVMNEPDTLWKSVNWETIIEFHKVTAAKLKAKFPHIRVGGPTYTGAINSVDKNNFHLWQNIRQFLDMSLYHLDFFSFHLYNNLHSHGGSHSFTGTNEARAVGIIDLIGSYSRQKRGFSVPLVISEYGLGSRDTDAGTPWQFRQWAYVYMRNAYTFTFLNHRDVMEQAIAFLLSHDTFGFADGSIYDDNGHETFVGNAYKFWKPLHYDYQFLRSDSQYNNAERTISSHALGDAKNKQVTVLLNNYKQNSEQVKLDFHNNWITPSNGHSTCVYADSNRHAHYSENRSFNLNNHHVTVPAEASCSFTFQTGHNFGGTQTVKQETHYAKAQAIGIHNNAVQTNINIGSGSFHSAQLRFGVSTGNKGANTTPSYVHINGHNINGHYSLYDSDRHSANTLWDIFVYNVPTNFLKQGENTVKMGFHQGGGSVSTAALLVGTMSGNGNPVG